jgi:hypothetical protein
MAEGEDDIGRSVEDIVHTLLHWDEYGYNAEDIIALGAQYGYDLAAGIEQGTPVVIGAMGEMIGALRLEGSEGITTAVEAFLNAMEITNYKKGLIEQYGETGGELASALADALSEGGPRAGASLARALDSALADAERAGIPDAKALGEELTRAMAAALASGSPEAVSAALSIIARMNEAMAEHADAPAETLAETFKRSWEENSSEIEPLGARTINDFMGMMTEAIGEGDATLIGEFATFAKDIVAAFTKGMDPKAASGVIDPFFDAIAEAIEEGTDEAMEKVKEALAELLKAGKAAGNSPTDTGTSGGGGSTFIPEQPGKVSTWQPTGSISFTNGMTRPARQDPSGAIYYQTGEGQWTRYRAADYHDPQTGDITTGGRASQVGYQSFARGSNYLPHDMLALVHKAEAIVPASHNPFNPSASAPMAMSGAGTNYNLTADFRGAMLTGSVEENADMVRKVFEDLIDDQLGHDAFLNGATVLR